MVVERVVELEHLRGLRAVEFDGVLRIIAISEEIGSTPLPLIASRTEWKSSGAVRIW